MWGRLAIVGAVTAGCAFQANQALQTDGGHDAAIDAPRGGSGGSGSNGGGSNGGSNGGGSGGSNGGSNGGGSNGGGSNGGGSNGGGSGGGTILPCPATYTLTDANHPGSSYRKVTASAGWSAAEAACEADEVQGVTGPGHLMVLDDQAEAAYAWSLNNSNQWLGESDTRSEGTFVPVTDQTAYFAGGASGNNGSKNCLMTKDSSGQTSADTCATGHPYICECDGNPADATHF